jgi:DNA-binding transcriptional MerR regulator
MAETQNSSYLSIGEVLGLLLEEFPDVTISKIRFLESQGLISPERTPSGYRKFYDEDVQRLRVILAEQRENYLPLRVIKDRLETGEIDPTGEQHRPADDNGASGDHDQTGAHAGDGHAGEGEAGDVQVGDGSNGPGARSQAHLPEHHDRDAADADPSDGSARVPQASVAAHPAARSQQPTGPTESEGVPTADDQSATGTDAEAEPEPAGDDHTPVTAQLLPGVLLDRAELCAMVGMTDDELSQLESFGIVAPRDSTGVALYAEDAVEIATPACEFLRSGVDARHLRNWRTSAEREALLFEQLVAPRFRQRNPKAQAEALDQLRRLDQLGGELRAALTRHALRHHFDA